jgi:hypothetical protein
MAAPLAPPVPEPADAGATRATPGAGVGTGTGTDAAVGAVPQVEGSSGRAGPDPNAPPASPRTPTGVKPRTAPVPVNPTGIPEAVVPGPDAAPVKSLNV